MINTRELTLLDSYKFISLSSKIEEYYNILPGKYIIYRYNSCRSPLDEAEYIDLKDNGEIGETNIDCWTPKKWSVAIHPVGYTAKNSFNIAGISTMEIIYMDEFLIYAKAYAKENIIMVKYDSLDLYNSNNQILAYFSNLENCWTNKLQDLKYVTCKVDSVLNDSFMYWGALLIGIVIAGIIELMSVDFWLSIVPSVIASHFGMKLFLYNKRNKVISNYKKTHPNDRLANMCGFNPFKFEHKERIF